MANVDMAAVARVSRRVDLQSIRLTELALTSPKLASPGNPLEPEFSQECVPLQSEPGLIVVSCSYDFNVRSLGEVVGDIRATYLIVYKLLGEEAAPTKEDVDQFASANGAYHSWPFVRELLFGLTSKMGYPPFTLPVLSFAGPRPKPEKKESETVAPQPRTE